MVFCIFRFLEEYIKTPNFILKSRIPNISRKWRHMIEIYPKLHNMFTSFILLLDANMRLNGVSNGGGGGEGGGS